MNDFLGVIEGLRFPNVLIDSLERSVLRLDEMFKVVSVL